MMTAAGIATLADGCPLLNTFIAKVETSITDIWVGSQALESQL